MINKGDKVVIIGDSNIGNIGTLGLTGVVDRVDIFDPKATYCVATPDDDDFRTVWYPATSVKPAVEEAPWIENTTGECPFKSNPQLLIDVKYRKGEIKTSVPANASFPGNDTTSAFWELDGFSNDIVAYRVVTGADGWIENTGVYPVDGDAALEVKFFNESEVWQSSHKDSWFWGLEKKNSGNIQYWRYKQPKPAPTLEEQLAAVKAELVKEKAKVQAMQETLDEIRNIL
jgi:hypothetical protein